MGAANMVLDRIGPQRSIKRLVSFSFYPQVAILPLL